jgi:hypothetical protein
MLTSCEGHPSACSAMRRPERGLPLGREAIDPEAAGVVTVAYAPVAINVGVWHEGSARGLGGAWCEGYIKRDVIVYWLARRDKPAER